MEAAHVVEILKETGPDGMHADDIYQAIIGLRPTSFIASLDKKNLTLERLGVCLPCFTDYPSTHSEYTSPQCISSGYWLPLIFYGKSPQKYLFTTGGRL